MKAYDQQIVIDLEFNPTPRSVWRQGLKSEIVEIGAVRLDTAARVVDVFSCCVRPELSDGVASNITELTGIRTCDVSQEPTLAEVLERLEAWIGSARTRIVAWSKSDREQIEAECAYKGIAVPAQLRRWLDLQVVYPRVMGVGNGRKMKLATAIDWYGVEIDSDKAHRALYDARATAELMRQLMTGEYVMQREALESAMPQRGNGSKPLSTKLGAACTELEALKLQLLASE